MRDVLWRMGFTLVALGVLLLIGPGVSCNLDDRLRDQIQGPTPQSSIADYLAATAEGDRQAALALWPAPAAGDSSREAQRESTTEELLGYGPRLEYRVLDVEWRQTCCEPGIANDWRQADAARFLVAISGENRTEALYLFEVLAPVTDEAGAQPEPEEPWTIVDVYPQDAALLGGIAEFTQAIPTISAVGPTVTPDP